MPRLRLTTWPAGHVGTFTVSCLFFAALLAVVFPWCGCRNSATLCNLGVFEDIVDEVGISRATFYKHFAERDEILAELFAQLLTTDVEPPQGGSSLERIQNLLVTASQQMTKWEDLARFVYSIPLRHDAVLPGGSGEPAVMTTVQGLVQEGVAAGELRSDVPADVLSRHLAGSFEAAMREWAIRQVDDAPERVRLLLDVAIGGLRPSN